MFAVLPVCLRLYMCVEKGHVYFGEVLAGDSEDGFDVSVMSMRRENRIGGGRRCVP